MGLVRPLQARSVFYTPPEALMCRIGPRRLVRAYRRAWWPNRWRQQRRPGSICEYYSGLTSWNIQHEVRATEPYTVKDAAPLLRLSPASVYALCAAKKLRHQRVGVGRGKIVIPPDAITEYLAKGTVPNAEAHPAAFRSASRR